MMKGERGKVVLKSKVGYIYLFTKLFIFNPFLLEIEIDPFPDSDPYHDLFVCTFLNYDIRRYSIQS